MWQFDDSAVTRAVKFGVPLFHQINPASPKGVDSLSMVAYGRQ
jgi:hypothetical protein